MIGLFESHILENFSQQHSISLKNLSRASNFLNAKQKTYIVSWTTLKLDWRTEEQNVVLYCRYKTPQGNITVEENMFNNRHLCINESKLKKSKNNSFCEAAPGLPVGPKQGLPYHQKGLDSFVKQQG